MNRILLHLILFAAGFYLVLCLFGCTRPPQPPLFSVSPPVPPATDEAQRLLAPLMGLAKEQTRLPGEPVVLRIYEVTITTPQAAELAVALAKTTGAPLLVILDGPGGNVIAGIDTARIISAAHLGDVRCQVRKAAFSMNAYLFEMLPCYRGIVSSAKLTFHHPHVDSEKGDTEEDFIRKAGVEENILDILCSFVEVASEGKVALKECKDHMHENKVGSWELSAQEALRLGLVDFVVPAKMLEDK